jgi:hypothetical protein
MASRSTLLRLKMKVASNNLLMIRLTARRKVLRQDAIKVADVEIHRHNTDDATHFVR